MASILSDLAKSLPAETVSTFNAPFPTPLPFILVVITSITLTRNLGKLGQRRSTRSGRGRDGERERERGERGGEVGVGNEKHPALQYPEKNLFLIPWLSQIETAASI